MTNYLKTDTLKGIILMVRDTSYQESWGASREKKEEIARKLKRKPLRPERKTPVNPEPSAAPAKPEPRVEHEPPASPVIEIPTVEVIGSNPETEQ